MKTINTCKNLKEKFCNLPEGNVFRFNNKYYMKTKIVFSYDDIIDLLDNDDIYDIDDIKAKCQLTNAISLDDNTLDYFSDCVPVEPLKTELHIV